MTDGVLTSGGRVIDPGGSGFFGSAAGLLSIFGAVNAAVGAYFSLESQKIAGKSQESNLRYQQEIAQINAATARERAAALDAQGKRALARFGMEAGERLSKQAVRQSASGVQRGVGSAKEAEASERLKIALQKLDIEGQILSGVQAAEQGVVNILNRARELGASAESVRATHESISPLVGLSTSLLGSAGTLAREWRYAQRDGYRNWRDG